MTIVTSLALAHDVRLAEGNGVGLLGHLALEAVQVLVLAEDHRVVVADRLDQQALGVVGVARAHDLQPGMWVNSGVSIWLCCAAARKPAPTMARITTGVSALPPNMYLNLAAWL